MANTSMPRRATSGVTSGRRPSRRHLRASIAASATALDDLLVPRRLRGPAVMMGPAPYFAAIFAFVNLHHYFMDHVIWRRDNPHTRYLFASRADGEPR